MTWKPREKVVFIINEFGDGLKPKCPYCKRAYPDASIFDVKNYPEDGGAIMFFECERCKEESELDFSWAIISGGNK